MVSAALPVGPSHARHPSGSRTSSIWTGHAATVALPKAKLLQLDHHQSSGRFTSPLRMGLNYSSSLRLRVHGTNPRAQARGRSLIGNVTECAVSAERRGRVQSRTPILGPDRALLALDPAANCKSLKPAKYVFLLRRKSAENLY
jgi:hypothetical protein